jgi:hypothetical protein
MSQIAPPPPTEVSGSSDPFDQQSFSLEILISDAQPIVFSLGQLNMNIASKVEIVFYFETPEPIVKSAAVEEIQNFATH